MNSQFPSVLYENIYFEYRNYSRSQNILERISKWKFSAFTLDITTGGRPLPVLLLHLMDHYGVMDNFKLEAVKVWKCFSEYAIVMCTYLFF